MSFDVLKKIEELKKSDIYAVTETRIYLIHVMHIMAIYLQWFRSTEMQTSL